MISAFPLTEPPLFGHTGFMRRTKISELLLRQAAACLLVVLVLLSGAAVSAGGDEPELSTAIYDGAGGARCMDVFAMDTYMTLSAYGEHADDALREAEAEIRRLDALLSTGDAESEISRLNAEGGGSLTEDTAVLVEASLALNESTGGLFDISIYPVMRLWGFTTQEYRVPDAEELMETLTLVDASRIEYEDLENAAGSVHFPEGMEIDVGGIAKGYTSARIMEIFRKNGVESAVVSLGGNVQVLGSKTDGSAWRIGIQDPDGGGYLGVLSVTDCAVITSGGYERYFEEDGVVYHHIIDPRTGYPAASGVRSVTIISRDGMLADGLSTSLYIMGEEAAETYWEDADEAFDFLIETDDGVLHVTEGAEALLATDRQVEIVTR